MSGRLTERDNTNLARLFGVDNWYHYGLQHTERDEALLRIVEAVVLVGVGGTVEDLCRVDEIEAVLLRPFDRRLGLPMLKQLCHGQTDIPCNLPKKNWRDIAASVERYGCRAACAVTKLLVRTALAYLDKAQALQGRDNFGGLEDRDIAHDSGDRDVLNPNEFRFKNWLALLKKHRKDFTKISVQFVECRTLRVCAGEAGNETNEETGVRVALDYGGVCFHGLAPEDEWLLSGACGLCANG